MITVSQIRAGRAMLGWSQKELAEKSGLSPNSLNNLERSVGSPRLETVEAVQAALEEGSG